MLSKYKRENLRSVDKDTTPGSFSLSAAPIVPANKPRDPGFNLNYQQPAITMLKEFDRVFNLLNFPRELTEEEKQENLISNIINSIKKNDPTFDILDLRRTEKIFSSYKSNQSISDLQKNTQLKLLKITVYLDQKKELRKSARTNKINGPLIYNNGLTEIKISLYTYGAYYILPYYDASGLERCWIGTENNMNIESPDNKNFSWIESENKTYSSRSC